MAKTVSNTTRRYPWFSSKSAKSSQLRKRKFSLSRRFELPAELLGGSLTLNHRRCGKPSCWCTDGQGHPHWVLTYSVLGEKVTLGVPHQLVDELEPLLARGKAYQEALTEIRAANAQLLHLWLKEQRKKKTSRPRRAKKRQRKRC
jgi:hypothetical protein